MKVFNAQVSMNSLRKFVQSSELSANRTMTTICQWGQVSKAAPSSSTHETWLAERGLMKNEICNPRHDGYRTVFPSQSRSFVTSLTRSADLSSLWPAESSHQDEYAYIMASHCPVSSEQCEKVRVAHATYCEESSQMDVKSKTVLRAHVDASIGGPPRLDRMY